MNRSQHIISLFETVTLEMHDKLNPVLWEKGDVLKPEVRKHLLAIAEKWKDFAKLPPKSTTDIVMLGGNAGFNYTKYSDAGLYKTSLHLNSTPFLFKSLAWIVVYLFILVIYSSTDE